MTLPTRLAPLAGATYSARGADYLRRGLSNDPESIDLAAVAPRYHSHTVLPADAHLWCEQCGAPDGPTWEGAAAHVLVFGPGMLEDGSALCLSCSDHHEDRFGRPSCDSCGTATELDADGYCGACRGKR